ncbi:chemotaxis protein CheW [Sulfurimonas sp.]|nr:chemotaxis protein CheW [Sulfurimonas sp.]
MQIQEILIIKNGSESYGISTDDINQISRVPSLMPLPFRPSCTRGLCGVGGSIVAMVDLNLLLNVDEVDMEASSSRLISLNDTHDTNALLVSEIYNTVTIKESHIDYLDNKDDPVLAIYKYKDSLVQVLSLDILISRINGINIKPKEIHNGKIKDQNTVEEDSSRFLVFAMGNENFALEIDFLREIILPDVNYTEIAGSSKELMGLITLRDELVAVMDLRTYYGFTGIDSDKNRILIASHNNETIGLLVDEIIDIKSILKKDVEYIDGASKKNKISGVIHDEDSLVSFFDREIIDMIFDENKAYIESNRNDMTDDESQDKEDSKEVIVFKLSGKEYAFDVKYVAEIIDIVTSTEVAYSDDDVDGIINIRGQIVPIVSLFDKLGIEAIANEDSKIIVCTIADNKVCFVVDSISDILDVLSHEDQEQDDDIFKSVLHLDDGKRLVLSMDVEDLVLRKAK